MYACLYFLDMPKVNYDKGLFGIRKWRYSRLDDIDLMCEISIFLNCSLHGRVENI